MHSNPAGGQHAICSKRRSKTNPKVVNQINKNLKSPAKHINQGFFEPSTWFPHYALPLLAPLALQTAPLWCAPIGRIAIILVACIGTFYGQMTLWRHYKHKGNIKIFSQMEQVIMANGVGCIFIYNGPIMLYDSLPYCKLSKYQFPSLFYFKSEQHATGMNPVQELHRILSRYPKYIVTQNPADENENPFVRQELMQGIQKNYKKIYTWQRDKRSIDIYNIK